MLHNSESGWRTFYRQQANAPRPGFAGPGHTAVEVFRSDAMAVTDPFVLLMDDHLNFSPGYPIGAAHPHAGLATVTVVVEGGLDDAHVGRLQAGDVEWLSAGAGVIHNEQVTATGPARILQLWMMLSSDERKAGAPGIRVFKRDAAPVWRGPGAQLRVYGGDIGLVAAADDDRLPLTVVDVRLEAGAEAEPLIEANQNTCLYVLDGALSAGSSSYRKGDVAWLRHSGEGDDDLRLRAGATGAHAFLFAGVPLNEPVIQHGPFVAGNAVELRRCLQRFEEGQFPRLSDIVR